MTIALAVIALLVGILIGAVGVGGILLIPAINLLAGLPLQAAMATALSTFMFTGIMGSWLFQRRGSIDWSQTVPICIGGALSGFIGAWVNRLIDADWLGLVLALLTVLAGLHTLFRQTPPDAADEDRPKPKRTVLLFSIGLVTGFGSGLTGVGGPALSVPIMVLFKFPLLSTIGTSQVIQVVAALSGSVGNFVHGRIDLPLAALLTVIEVAGVWIGVRLGHSVDARFLRRAVGVLCIVAGLAMGVRFATRRGHDDSLPLGSRQPTANAVKEPVIRFVSCFMTT